MSDATTITIGVIAFFALIAVLTVIRLLLRRDETRWRRLRVGFFVERDKDDNGDRAAG